MDWMDRINSGALDWLLEKDSDNPSVRYLALKELLGKPEGDGEVIEAFRAVMQSGPIPKILAQQDPQGFWFEPGPGYNPKYSSIIWEIILLAQLGANVHDERILKACDYLLEHARGRHGGFSMSATPSGAAHCLQGNLCYALYGLGLEEDERLLQAAEWMACSVTGGVIRGPDGSSAPIQYYRSGISGPGFLCSANDHQPCAWGAVKVALGLAKISPSKRTPEMNKAARVCVDFLLSVDPATAEYPHPYAPKASSSWFKFGFPVFYITDVLQTLEALLESGLAGDARLQNAIDLLLSKQDAAGRWPMEYSYNGKMLVEIEEKKKPSKWVTLRALRVLKQYYSL